MFDDMGIFRTTVGVENPLRAGDIRELSDVMVDTGSEYTWLPRSLLESLGLESRRVVRFVTADGREIDRDIAFAHVYAGGTSAPDIVVFAEPGDMVLLGAHSLGGLNLRIDLIGKRLIPAGPVPVATGRVAA
jgi:predicted aspartyl protease